MKKWNLKLQPVEAIQYMREENASAVQYFFNKVGDAKKFRYQETLEEYAVLVKGKGGRNELVILEKGDYIFRDIFGIYSVMKESLFLKLYERADESE